MGLPITVLLEILLYWTLIAITYIALRTVFRKVRQWDRASVGLVAGTHLHWSEETAQKIRDYLDQEGASKVELDISPNAADFHAHMAMAADALTQLQKTMLGFREPVAETIRSLQGVVRELGRPGIHFTHTYTGAGRYKFTYTEGTIHD